MNGLKLLIINKLGEKNEYAPRELESIFREPDQRSLDGGVAFLMQNPTNFIYSLP